MTNDHLLEQIAAPENLLQAWRAVRGNIPKYRRARARGPDGVSMTEFEQDLQAQLAALRDMLLHERFQPQPPKRFHIKKKSGGERELAVLSVVDRVAQRATVQILEPYWERAPREGGFLPCSFGFRPGRSVDQALAVAQHLRARGEGWVVDGDIEACFDSLDHDLLEKFLQRKITDHRVLKLIQKWLDVGALKAGMPLETEDSFADWLKSAQKTIQRGLDWALASATAQEDPYAAARYEEALRGIEIEEEAPPEASGEDTLKHMRRAALRRVVINGLVLGASWGRDIARIVGDRLSETFRTPQGRRLLKRGAIATGGLAGVAAAGALAAYLLQRKAGPAPTGVLQGSPLSPLLTNIYLHPFDVRLSKNRHHLVRFADDWVILAADQVKADRAYNEAFEALARLRLHLNTEKTKIHPPDEPFEWLGGVIK